jgi:hypothetical protein
MSSFEEDFHDCPLQRNIYGKLSLLSLMRNLKKGIDYDHQNGLPF